MPSTGRYRRATTGRTGGCTKGSFGLVGPRSATAVSSRLVPPGAHALRKIPASSRSQGPTLKPELRIAALLTCHNRRALTLGCVESLLSQAGHDAVVTPYVTDDGSTDGTAMALQERFPEAVVLEGDGSLFWVGGMRMAYTAAERDDPTHHLWMNDDTHLDADAIALLLTAESQLHAAGKGPVIVVGSTRDPDTDALTYGGVSRTDPSRPLKWDWVVPRAQPVEVETMNGNCVLVPREIVREIGNIDPAFSHKMGDFDYGLRARVRGFGIWLAPGTVGTCARNAPPSPGSLSRRDRLRRLVDTKELPPHDWREFSRRYAGPAWPLYWASPYLRRGARILLGRD